MSHLPSTPRGTRSWSGFASWEGPPLAHLFGEHVYAGMNHPAIRCFLTHGIGKARCPTGDRSAQGSRVCAPRRHVRGTARGRGRYSSGSAPSSLARPAASLGRITSSSEETRIPTPSTSHAAVWTARSLNPRDAGRLEGQASVAVRGAEARGAGLNMPHRRLVLSGCVGRRRTWAVGDRRPAHVT